MKDKKNRYPLIKNVNSDEEEVIDIYRHLNGQNKCLIRRTIKNLDTYYSDYTYQWNTQFQDYFWNSDTPEKVTLFNHRESDLLNSFRALNEQQQFEVLSTLHTQILKQHSQSNEIKFSKEEIKLINDFRNLNSSGQKLIKETVKTLLTSAAGNVQNKNKIS